jgi:hypothetical protein
MFMRALGVLTLVVGVMVVWWWPSQQAAVAQASLPVPVPAGASAAVRPVGGKPPKAWSVIQGQLVPGRALRERFDSYLPLGRGVTMVEVRATLDRDAQADLGPVLSPQVLAVWDRYARLQTYEWRAPFNSSDPKGWQATLNEQHQMRRQLLGAEWAEAFFEEDEAALQRRMASVTLAASRPRPVDGAGVDDVMALAPPAAGSGGGGVMVGHARTTDAKDAKQEWARLAQDSSLDEAQRLLRMRHYLQQNFSDEDTARIEAELQLP